jgi:alpha-beta hydrolase superfamily lysophospholipase
MAAPHAVTETARVKDRAGRVLHLHRFPYPEGAAPVARILYVHGRGEHGGRFEPIAAELAPHRLICSAIDLPGFGLTVPEGSAPGGLRALEEYFDAILGGLAHVDDSGPAALPRFIVAHSMGGLAAIRLLETADPELAARERIRGLILSGPFLEMTTPLAGLKRLVVGALSALSPDKPLPSRGTPNTRDAERRRAYENDPLTVKSPTARWVVEMLKHQPLAIAEAAKLAVPVLVLQGGADDATAPAASRRFAEACGGTYKEYAGLFHEVLNEPPEDRARVIADLVAWVAERAR